MPDRGLSGADLRFGALHGPGQLLNVYVVDPVATDIAAAERYPGVAAHLAACGPCSEDFARLLAAVGGTAN